MTYHWIIPLLAALASVALSYVVFRYGPRTPLRTAFVGAALALACWNGIYVILYSVHDQELAFLLTRAIRSGAMFLFPGVLHIIVTLPGRPRRASLWAAVYADYALFAMLVLANFLDLLVSDLRWVGWGYYSIGTPLYDVFTALVILTFLLSLILLIYEYRTTREPRMRLQLKFWLFGMALALPLGLTNLLPAYGVPLYPLGNLGSAVWAGIVAYAIVRHRLMDIEVVVSKGLAFIGVAAVLIGPAFATVVILQKVFFGEIHYDFSAVMLVLLLGIGVAFPAIRQVAEARVERSLFPAKIETRAALESFTRTVIRILDRDVLGSKVCETLCAIYGIESAALFLLEDIRGRVELRHFAGHSPKRRYFGSDHPFVRWLAHRGEAVLREEVAHGARGEIPGIDATFRECDWAVCVPLVSGKELIGFLGLGRRAGLNAFSAGDLEGLETLAAQLAVALENARLYAELRRSQEIISRTGRLSALGTLAAGIAHEIRNPLVSIHTFFQLAPERINDSEFMTSFLRLAEAEVQRINGLITELLTFAKPTISNVSCIDIHDVIRSTAMLLVPQSKSAGVGLNLKLGGGVAPVLADPDEMKQVFVNLILNGIQATSRGGEVSVETRLLDGEISRLWQVEISDTGAGIPGDLLESIFNPFFTTKDRGTGLGLPIAHRIINEAGGYISIESVEGRGTTVLIHLPASVDVPTVA